MTTKLNQKGAVSLLSVVIFATIITVLITAYMRAAVSQQSEALAYDLSNRAYYAAESGVQDTLSELRADPAKQVSKNTSCAPIDVSRAENFGYTDFGVGYTCQLITVNPQELTGTVSPNQQSAMMQLKPAVAVANPKIILRWSEQTPNATNALFPRGSSSSLFTPSNLWNALQDPNKPIHSLIRLSVISHPNNTPTFNREDITQRVLFLNPTDNSAPGSGAVVLSSSGDILEQQQQLISNAECYPSDKSTTVYPPGMNNYSCRETISLNGYNFADQAIYLRIGAVYRSTKFSVQLMNGSNPANLQGAQIEIDITGKAGENTYRRLKQNVSLGGFDIQYGPDAALVAGEGICKNFVIGTTPNTYQQGCNPLTN